MSNEIRADYEELENLASRFAHQSEATQQLLEKVRSRMDPLRNGGWEGRAAERFFGEMDGEVIPVSQKLQAVLENGSQITRAIIQMVRQAEEEASSLFRRSR